MSVAAERCLLRKFSGIDAMFPSLTMTFDPNDVEAGTLSFFTLSRVGFAINELAD